MFKKMCIRNKLLTAFFILLVVDLGMVFMLEKRAEKGIRAFQSEYEKLLDYSGMFNRILGGDIRSVLVLTKDRSLAEEMLDTPYALAIIQKFRNHVLLIFGSSLLLFVSLSIYITRKITKSILQLTNSPGIDSDLHFDTKKLKLKCTALNSLCNSLEHLKEDIREREEMRSAVDSVEFTKNLAAGVAHEIKNPINTVGLIAEYIQKNLSPDNPEKRYEFYKLSENMKKELSRINRVVEGFLRLTKPHVYNFQKESINSVVNDAVSLFKPECIKQGVRIGLDLDPDIPLIDADRDKLMQVFSNLIINSIEAMPRGGTIEISSSRMKNEHVIVRISDNGVGIPEDMVHKVYNPFYTTKKQGFGLGLSLIQEIVHQHQGKISLSSDGDKGAEFVLQLPVEIKQPVVSDNDE